MSAKKKHLLFLIVAVLAVVVVGTTTVTYAWFLSQYSSEYEFQLDSEESNRLILIYESDLAFANGNISTPSNALIPATAKATIGIEQGELDPLDVFDVDTVNPAHTGMMASAAQAVHYTAKGAYWVGSRSTAGELSFTLNAYVKEGGVADTTYDLAADGEIAYFVLFTYMGENILYYNGRYYKNDTVSYTLTMPDIFTASTLRYWRPLVSTDTKAYRGVTAFALTTDGTQLLLAPNSSFIYDLYVFVAKPDELLDDAVLNGKTLQLNATISVPALAQNP